MLTVLEIITKSAEFLAQKGVESARLNAEHVIGHALGLKRMQLYLQFERMLTEVELEKIRPLVRRRAQREPLSYILGHTEFYGLTLKTDARALVPRPETEELIELLETRLKATPPTRILDLGTGTGAIALALAKAFPAAVVIGVDRSSDALALARENAIANGLGDAPAGAPPPTLASAGADGPALSPDLPAETATPGPVTPPSLPRVRFVPSDWFSALERRAAQGVAVEPFELIVSNPPYLTEAEWAEAEPEVRTFEPRGALVAADEGAADLRHIIAAAPRWLAPGGLLALETGIAQHAALLAACAAAGLREAESRQDLRKRDRFVLARK